MASLQPVRRAFVRLFSLYPSGFRSFTTSSSTCFPPSKKDSTPVFASAALSIEKKGRIASTSKQKLVLGADLVTKPVSERLDLANGTYVVTGGGRGLGLSLAMGLAEAGGKVWCFDCCDEPSADFLAAQAHLRYANAKGGLEYQCVDATDPARLDQIIQAIAAKHGRLNGVIAAAGLQQDFDSIGVDPAKAQRAFDIELTSVFAAATSCARALMRHKSPRSSSPSSPARAS